MILLADCTVGVKRRRRRRLIAAGAATLLASGAATVGLRAHHRVYAVMGAVSVAEPQTPAVVEPSVEPPAPPDQIKDTFAPTIPTSAPPPQLKMGKLVRAR